MAITSLAISISLIIGGVIFIAIHIFINNTQAIDLYNLLRYIYILMVSIIFYLIFYNEVQELANQSLEELNKKDEIKRGVQK